MQKTIDIEVPKTTTDVIFDQLYEDISSLAILPGARISEADVATRLGVSRQPVRDAFNRLGNLGLLLIRPQRATEVRRFSMNEIENARFIRLSVELEVISRACAIWTDTHAKALDANLSLQVAAIESDNLDGFHALDYEFHRIICELGGAAMAFKTIQQYKRPVDRLCVLSLGRSSESSAILEDHQNISGALAKGSIPDARAAMKLHLSRLDDTIAELREKHAEYFE